MNDKCSSFEKCSAPLCPLDKDLSCRLWYHDEPICNGRPGSGRRWIAKQRSIQKRLTRSWLNRPIGYQELFDKSRKRELSPEQIEKLRTHMSNIRK